MKKSIVFSILGLLALSAGLVAGILLVKQNQNIQEKAAPASTIYLSPGSQSKSPGSNFTFSVILSTGSNAVTGIDIELKFDPTAIQINSLTQGSGAANLNQTIKNTFDNATGTISYSVFTLNSSNAVTGSDAEVLKVNATVTSSAASGNYNISFDPSTSASASQEGQNVLIGETPAILTVTTAQTSSSPTPSSSASITPTPVVTSTIAPLVTQSTTTGTPPPTLTSSKTPIPIPVTGIEWPTVIGAGIGIFAIVGSLLIAL